MAAVGRAVRCLGLVGLVIAGPVCAAPDVRVEVINPRPFGHAIGDVLERRVAVEVSGGLALGELPRAGRIDALLEARTPAVTASRRRGHTRYEILLAYQIIGSPESVTTAVLPAVPLAFVPAEAAPARTVPDWPITVAPLAPVHVLGRAGLEEMRPDREPAAIPTRPMVLRLGLYALTAMLLGLYLAYRRYGLPWWPGGPGPFARAYRDLRSLGAAGERDARRAAFQRVHRAFEETAGRAVFANDLPQFFAAHPRFNPVRDAIEAFYEASRREFFGEAPGADAPIADLLALCRECRRRERGGR